MSHPNVPRLCLNEGGLGSRYGKGLSLLAFPRGAVLAKPDGSSVPVIHTLLINILCRLFAGNESLTVPGEGVLNGLCAPVESAAGLVCCRPPGSKPLDYREQCNNRAERGGWAVHVPQGPPASQIYASETPYLVDEWHCCTRCGGQGGIEASPLDGEPARLGVDRSEFQ